MLQVKVARYQGKNNISLTISKKNNPTINGYIEVNLAATTPKADEESRLFHKIAEILKTDDFEVITKDFTAKDFKSFSTKQLQDKFLKMGDSTPGAKELIEEVLRDRNALPQPKEEKAKEPAAPKMHKSKPKKAEGAKTGSERELKKMLSDEEVAKQLEEARKNNGKQVKFFCQKTQRHEIGTIKTARLDKRSNFIQYRIVITEGASKGLVFGKGIDSMDLEFTSKEGGEQ